MTTHTQSRIAAALALAEADDAWYGQTVDPPETGWDAASKAHYLALQAYRSTAPKLRTRSEVDAEIVQIVRTLLGPNAAAFDPSRVLEQLRAMAAEQTAKPLPRPGCPEHCWCHVVGEAAGHGKVRGPCPCGDTGRPGHPSGWCDSWMLANR